MCAHPLVSPISAGRERWRGAPAVYINVGWEGFSDEAEVLARRVYESARVGIEKGGEGGMVVFDGFEGMPHCFAVVPFNWAGREGLKRWGRFCGDVVRGKSGERVSRSGRATWTSSKTGLVREVGLGELGMTHVGCGYERKTRLDDEEVDRRIEGGMRWRVMLEEEMIRKWKEEGNLAQVGDV